jgi:predicted RecA/RadA family phage recombinase
MKNYVQEGRAIDVVAPVGGLTSGAFYYLNGLMGVVAVTAVQDDPSSIYTKGVFTLPKATSEAWAIGDALYWDVANSRFTKTAGVNRVPAGFAGAVAGSSDTTGNVVIGYGQGLKTICGQQTTVAAADTIITGLSKVLSVVASYETDPADANTFVSAQIGDQAGAPASGSIIIKTWKSNDGTDVTPVAATAFAKKVNWIAVGY